MSRTFRRVRPVLAGVSAVVAVAASGVLAAPQGANLVSIDAQDAYVPERESAFWVFQTTSPSIPLVLSEPAAGPASVSYVTSNSPGLGTVHFGEGAQAGSASFTVPATTPNEFYPGWGARWSYFALTSTTGGLQHGEPSVMYMIQAAPLGTPARGLGTCYICMWSLLCCLFELMPCDPFCTPPPAPSPRGSSDTEVYARYRDEILASTAVGQYYVDLYEQHGLDAILASLAAPFHAVKFRRAWSTWTPALRALVDGTGGGATVSAQMQDDLLALLDILEDNGSPALAGAIATERSRLQLDSIAGLTMTEFQTQVETLGGPNALQPATWGRVKALYR